MTRQELIDKLYEWYCEWVDNQNEPLFKEITTADQGAYLEKRSILMKEDKMRRLNIMSNEQLENMFVQELIRREGYANES